MAENKNQQLDNFDANFSDFLSTTDWKVHCDAAAGLAKTFNAKTDYLKAVKLGRFNIAILLANMEEASRDKLFSRGDKKGMAKMGKLAADAYENKRYCQIAVLADGLVFKHLAENLNLAKRSDFKTLTDHDLFSKGIIPNEIFFQYFILESLAKNKKFNWERDEKIISQTFILAGICFAGIYDYFEFCDESREESRS